MINETEHNMEQTKQQLLNHLSEYWIDDREHYLTNHAERGNEIEDALDEFIQIKVNTEDGTDESLFDWDKAETLEYIRFVLDGHLDMIGSYESVEHENICVWEKLQGQFMYFVGVEWYREWVEREEAILIKQQKERKC